MGRFYWAESPPPPRAPTLPSVHMVWLGYSVSVVRYLLKCGMWRLHLLRLFLSRLMFCSSLQGDTIPSSGRVSLQWARNIVKNEHKARQLLFSVDTNRAYLNCIPPLQLMLQYNRLGAAFSHTGCLKRLADELQQEKKLQWSKQTAMQILTELNYFFSIHLFYLLWFKSSYIKNTYFLQCNKTPWHKKVTQDPQPDCFKSGKLASAPFSLCE